METKKQYLKAKKIEHRLSFEEGDAFYATQKELQIALRPLLSSYMSDWGGLNKREILHILSMCSSHRPVALHSVLISASMQYDKLYKKTKPCKP